MEKPLSAKPASVWKISDLDEFVEAIYGTRIVPCLLSERLVSSTLRRLRFSDACLDFHSIGPTMLFEGEMPKGSFTLSFVLFSPGLGRAFNFGVSHSDLVIGFFPPGSNLDAIAPSGSDHAILSISADTFLEKVSEIWPEMPDEMLKTGLGLPVNSEDARELGHLLDEIRGWMENSDSEKFSNPSVLEELKQELVTNYLIAIRNAITAPAPMPARLTAVSCQKLAHAREYIASHLGESVEVAEIAEASDLSERGLQKLFHTQLGLSPIAFHRRLRLCGANLDLHYSAEKLGGVKRIALKWGFWHHGRFAHEYRELFGENPSDTLVRGKEKHRELQV